MGLPAWPLWSGVPGAEPRLGAVLTDGSKAQLEGASQGSEPERQHLLSGLRGKPPAPAAGGTQAIEERRPGGTGYRAQGFAITEVTAGQGPQRGLGLVSGCLNFIALEADTPGARMRG